MEMWLNFYVSDEVVCKSYGECWLSYFFRMRRYGLSHIWDEMHEQLSTDLRSDESSRPVERDRCDSWVPFSQWRSVFWQWARGQITAGDVRVQYGEAWLSLFTRVSTFGLEPYREELGDYVWWDVWLLRTPGAEGEGSSRPLLPARELDIAGPTE